MESQQLQMQSDHSKDQRGLVVGLPWIVYGFSMGCMVGLPWIVCGFATGLGFCCVACVFAVGASCFGFGLLVGGGWLRERNGETEIRERTEIKREEG